MSSQRTKQSEGIFFSFTLSKVSEIIAISKFSITISWKMEVTAKMKLVNKLIRLSLLKSPRMDK